MPSIIERYADIISGGRNFEGITDAPRDFQEATGQWLVSTLIGRRVLIYSLPEMKFEKMDGGAQRGNKAMNLWFMFIGKSRISRKTTAIFKGRNLIKSLSKDILLADDFTPQSLVLTMKRRKSGEPCAWVHDEISGFFEQLRSNKSYMLTADTVLSRLYDGQTYTKETVGRGLEEIEDAYLTALLASTESLPTLFDRGRFKQGFLNRFIYVVPEIGKSRDSRKTLTEEEIKEVNRIVSWFKALFNFSHLKYVYSVDFSFDASEWLKKHNKSVEAKIRKGVNSLGEGFLANQPNVAERLSGIYRLSRLKKRELKKGIKSGTIVVEEKDAIKAILYLNKSKEWFSKVLILMGKPVDAPAPKTVDKDLPHVINAIKECHKLDKDEPTITRSKSLDKTGNPYCTRTQLKRATRIMRDSLTDILELAMADGRVQRHYKQKKKGKGRPTIFYELLPKERKRT